MARKVNIVFRYSTPALSVEDWPVFRGLCRTMAGTDVSGYVSSPFRAFAESASDREWQERMGAPGEQGIFILKADHAKCSCTENVGLCRIVPTGSGSMEIREFFIREDHRRTTFRPDPHSAPNKTSRMLFQAALGFAREREAGTLTIAHAAHNHRMAHILRPTNKSDGLGFEVFHTEPGVVWSHGIEAPRVWLRKNLH